MTRDPRNKFGAVKTEVDGIVFDSRKEAKRYQDLKYLQLAGEIMGLTVHPTYDLVVNGRKVCIYEADFAYTDLVGPSAQAAGGPCKNVEDVKGVKTPIYRLKKKLMLAVHGITVSEVT